MCPSGNSTQNKSRFGKLSTLGKLEFADSGDLLSSKIAVAAIE